MKRREQMGYFVVHAPRQTGKTTALRARAEHLTAAGKGVSIHVSAPAQGESPDAQTALGHAAIVPSIDSLDIVSERAP
jgi:hypothetical protein